MWWSTSCFRPHPGAISSREPIARPGSGTARATSRHARTPAAPEPRDLEAVANGLRRGGGAGRSPAPRRRARAAGLRRGAPQVGENPVDHSGLGNEGDDLGAEGEVMGEEYTFNQKVADFEQAVQKHILDAAEILLDRDPPLDLAALRLLIGYFEPIAKYLRGYAGTHFPSRYFTKGCRDVVARRFSVNIEERSKQLEGLYALARCGLAHGATLSREVVFGVGPYALLITADGRKIVVNPRKLHEVLSADLERYLTKIRDPSEKDLREKFERRWDFESGAAKK